jgi:hypothetical protein
MRRAVSNLMRLKGADLSDECGFAARQKSLHIIRFTHNRAYLFARRRAKF